MGANKQIDWYARSDELEDGQVFIIASGDVVKLDRRVPGDGTDWYVADWSNGSWAYMDSRIHPGDLVDKFEDAPTALRAAAEMES